MNSKAFWAVLVFAAIAIGGGYYYLTEQGMSAAPAANAANSTAEKTVTVEAEKVTIGPVIEDIRAVGTLQTNEPFIIHRKSQDGSRNSALMKVTTSPPEMHL